MSHLNPVRTLSYLCLIHLWLKVQEKYLLTQLLISEYS